jgi:hypothetical protein
MARAATRITPVLYEALVRLDDPTVPIAETCRRVGARAEELAIPRPSYEHVRVLIKRERGRARSPSTPSVLFDVAVRVRPPDALLDHLSGVGVSTR